MSFVYKLLFVLIATTLCHCIYAQQVAPAGKSKTAPVEVTVTDSHKQPRTAEQVLFKPKKGGKLFEGRTDKTGKLLISLPVGDEYSVMLNTLNDSTYFGNLPIAALGGNEAYTKPFVLSMTYEPSKEFTLNNVYFETGKTTLQPASFKQLQDLYEYMKWKDSVRIEVGGHTDNVGNDNENTILSQKRAETVKAWLVQKGVDGSRIIAKGYGASMPIEDNSSEAGRKKNRRTEVTIL